MRRNDPASPCGIGPPAVQVLRAFERTLSGTKSEALLIWPQQPDCVAIFHALASLNCMSACDTEGLVTLYFPWSRGATATQRHMLVDRNFVYEATLPVLNRLINTDENHPSFGYVLALHSLKYLPEKRKKDARFMNALSVNPGLIHPTLFEIMPQLGIQQDSLHDYHDQFLRRLSRHTWITEKGEYMEAATRPSQAPFFFFGVHADAIRPKDIRNAGISEKDGGRRPDIVLVDLTYRGRSRLGNHWQQSLNRFFRIIGDLFGRDSPPVFAVTDDVFVLQRLRWDALKAYDKERGTHVHVKRPAISHVVLHPKPHVMDHETVVPSPAPAITAEVYGNDVLILVEQGIKLRQSLLNTGDSELASTVTAAITSIQNLVGIPGSAHQFYDFLADRYEDYEHRYYGSRFDYLAPRSQIKLAMQQGLGGMNQDQLSEFFSAFEKVCESTASQTPGSVLFRQCMVNLVRNAERSLVVFSSDVLLDFARWRIENDEDLAQVGPYLGGKIVLSGRREAIEELELHQHEEHSYNQVVFIEPHAEHLLHLLTQSFMPKKVLVLANLALARSALNRSRALLKIKGIEPIRENLRVVEEKLGRALSGRVTNIPEIDLSPRLPRLSTLDLTSTEGRGPGTEETRLIATSGSLTIRAFDGSEMAFYDADALQSFSLRFAKDLKPGNEICAFSPDFLNMAREKLNFTANASNVLALYHRAVAESVQKLPGSDMASKVHALRERMLQIDPAIELPGNQAMRQWIDVQGLIDAPRNKVRPQAPRDRHHYLCFMRSLGVTEDVADRYWDLGIASTRSIRISRGSTFRRIFMAVLIDPHGVASQIPEERRKDVWAIHEAAEHHVVKIISNRREVKSHESC